MNNFSFDSISNFDNHISSSINGYKLLDELIINLSSFWTKKGTTILDIGCTSGRLIDTLKRLNPDCECIGYDITNHNFIHDTSAILKVLDVSSSDAYLPYSNFVLSIFTLQFIEIEKRASVLRRIYDSLSISGAFIIAEKEISSSGVIQEAFTFANYDYKRANFTPDEILSKEKDLRKIMNCLQDGENVKLLQSVGFKPYQFYQGLNFKAWICLK